MEDTMNTYKEILEKMTKEDFELEATNLEVQRFAAECAENNTDWRHETQEYKTKWRVYDEVQKSRGV